MNKLSIKTQTEGDAYSLHRTALRPLLPGADEDDLIESCKQIERIGEEKFIYFLHEQGLAPLWDKALGKDDNSSLISDIFIEAVHQSRLTATGAYMLQSQGLKKIKSIFEDDMVNFFIVQC